MKSLSYKFNSSDPRETRRRKKDSSFAIYVDPIWKKNFVLLLHTRQDITKILGAGGELTSIVLVMYIIIGNQKETKKIEGCFTTEPLP